MDDVGHRRRARGVEERAPRAAPAPRPSARRRRPSARPAAATASADGARRGLQAVAVGHEQRAGRGAERHADVDDVLACAAAARRRRRRPSPGGAEEDDLVRAAEPRARARARARRCAAVVASAHARTQRHERSCGAGRTTTPGGGAGELRRGARRRAGRGAAGATGRRRGQAKRERAATAGARRRMHVVRPRRVAALPRWRAIRSCSSRRPTGLADGLAHDHALPGGNAWIRPRTTVPPIRPSEADSAVSVNARQYMQAPRTARLHPGWLSWPGRLEDLRRHPTGPRAQLAARRRRGPDPRPSRDPDRRRAARQAQADLHAARGHGRLRRRRERREDRGDRRQAPGEALPPPLRLSRAA